MSVNQSRANGRAARTRPIAEPLQFLEHGCRTEHNMPSRWYSVQRCPQTAERDTGAVPEPPERLSAARSRHSQQPATLSMDDAEQRVRREQHFVALRGIGDLSEGSAGVRLHVSDFEHSAQAADEGVLTVPVELEGLAVDRNEVVQRGIPGNAARILRKKCSSSRYPQALPRMTLMVLLMPSTMLVLSGWRQRVAIPCH